MSRVALYRPSDKTDYAALRRIADEVERIRSPSRFVDVDIMLSMAGLPRDTLYIDMGEGKKKRVVHAAPFYTIGFNPARALGGTIVFASDIGADGLPIVKVVFDTSTSPVVEHTGIARRLEFALLSATLRGISHGKC
jgi:hypothetical protein